MTSRLSTGVSLLALCISGAALGRGTGSGPIAETDRQERTIATANPQDAGDNEIYFEITEPLAIIESDTATPPGNSLHVQAQATVTDAVSQIVTAPNADVSSTILNYSEVDIGAEAVATGTSESGEVVSAADARLIGGFHQEATVEGGGNGTAMVSNTNAGSYTGYATARTSSDGDASSDAILQETIFMRAQANGAGDGTTQTDLNNLGTLQFHSLADSLSSDGNAASTALAGGGEHGLIHLRAAANGVGLDSATVNFENGSEATLEASAQSRAQGLLDVESTAVADGALVMKAQGNGQDNADIVITLDNFGTIGIATDAQALSTGPAGSANALATMNSAIVQTSEEGGPLRFVGRSGTVAISNAGEIAISSATRATALGDAVADTRIEAAILQEAENNGFAGTSFANSGAVNILGEASANGLSATAMTVATGIEQELFGLGAGGGALAAFENTGEVRLALSAMASAAGGEAQADAAATGFSVWGEPVNIAVANRGLFTVTAAATANGTAQAEATGMAFLATWNPTIVVPEDEEGHGHGGGAGEHGEGHNGHGGPGEGEEGDVVWEEAATNAITGTAFNDGMIHVSADAVGQAPGSANAKALYFEAAAVDADFTNSGSILAEAVTNGGVSQAYGIRVVDFAESPIEPLATDLLLIENNGGAITARTSSDGGATWEHGLAIDTTEAPNPVAIAFSGPSQVYGHIDISPDDAIRIANGRLTFDGTINPDAALQGSLSIGSGGTLYLTNNQLPAQAYVQSFAVEEGGTLALQLSSGEMDAPYPQVFTNTANLDGALLLGFTTPSGLYDEHYSWQDVIDANVLTGVFTDVALEYGSIFLDPTASYDADANVDVSISRVPFDDGRFELTPNQLSAAGGIEQVYTPAITGPFADLAAQLFAMNDPATYASALSNVHGAQYATYAQSLGRMGSRFNAVLADMGGCGALEFTDNSLRCRRENAAGIWGNASYLREDIDSDPAIDATGYRSDQLQLAIGGDVRIGRAGVIGVAGGYVSNEGDFDWFNGRADTDGWQVGVYGAYDPGALYVRGAASYSSISGTASRDVQVGMLSGDAAASVDADIWAVGGELGYRIPARFATATPYVGLDWVSSRIDGFTETGTAPGLLAVGDSTNHFLTSELGLKLDADLGDVMARANVGWRHEFNGSPAAFTASFAQQPGSSFQILGPNTGPDSVVADFSLAANMSDRLTARLGYQGLFGNGVSSNGIYGNVTARLGAGTTASTPFASGLAQTLAPVLKLDAELAGIYDDNIFGSRNDKVTDFIAVLRPSARLQFGDAETYLEFGGRGELARNADNTSEDYSDWTVDWDSRLRLGEGASLILNGHYLWTHEARTSPEAVFGLEPTRYRRGYGVVGLMLRRDDWIARLAASGTTYNFDDTPTSFGTISNGDRNRSSVDVALRLGHKVTPAANMFVQASYGSTNYERTFDDFGYRRESDGTNLVLGMQRSKRDGLSGEIFAGYLQRSFDDPRLPDISTFDLGVLVDWEGSRSNATFRVDRGIGETTFVGASAYLHTDGSLTVSTATGPRLATGITLSANHYDYIGIDRQELALGAGLWGRYWLNNRIYAGVGYDFTQRTSNVASYSYNENRFQLSVGAQLQPRYVASDVEAAWNGGSQAPAGAYAAVLIGHGSLMSAVAGPREPDGFSTEDLGGDGFSYGLAAGYGVTWDPIYLGFEVGAMGDGPDWQHTGGRTFSIDRDNSLEVSARAGFVTPGRGLAYGRFGYVSTRLKTSYDTGVASVDLSSRSGGMGLGFGIDTPVGGHGFLRAEYVINSYRDYDVTLAGGTMDNFAHREGQFRLGAGMRLGSNTSDARVEPTDFSGPYVGLSIGHGALVSHATDMLAGQAPVDAMRANLDGIFGAFAGYGLMTGPVYIGAEIEGELSNLHWDSEVGSDGTAYTMRRHGAYGASARIGMRVGAETLVFGRLGATRARFDTTYDFAEPPISSRFWRTGLQAGAGLEVGLSSHIRIRGEYVIRDYDTFQPSNGTDTLNLSNKESVFRAGFALKI